MSNSTSKFGHVCNHDGDVVGIDPGMSGAFVVIDQDGFFIDRKCDFVSLQDLSASLRLILEGVGPALGVIEAVHAMPGQGVTSMFSFGRSTGAALGVLHSCGYGEFLAKPLATPPPAVWKRDVRTAFAGKVNPEWLGLGPEFDSRRIALQLWPEATRELRRKKDHGTADAALLAYWGKYLSITPTHGTDKVPRSIYAK